VDHSTPDTSADLLNASTIVNVSGVANTTSSTMGKGSVRDRMREWERERERIREMERLAEMQREAESILTSAHEGSDDETEMSDEEVECTLQKDEQEQEAHGHIQASPVEAKMEKEVACRDADEEIDANITSYRADLSEEHVQIARIGAKASAQFNGSFSALGMVRSSSASTTPGGCSFKGIHLGFANRNVSSGM